MARAKKKKKAKKVRMCALPGTMPSHERNLLPSSLFALPEQRKYPLYRVRVMVDGTVHYIPSGSHAANAKARAAQQFALGNLTLAQYERIIREADKVLKKCKTTGERRLEEALKGAT